MKSLGAHTSVPQQFVILTSEEVAAKPAFAVRAPERTITVRAHEFATASAPFRETKRKIEDGEDPFEPPPFDPETATDFDPPFLEEWQEADESLNIQGQAALKLVHGALHDYLKAFVDLYQVPLTASGKNWLERSCAEPSESTCSRSKTLSSLKQ